VEKHGSESYYIVGEGLIDVADGGRTVAALDTEDTAPPFRFSRMGPRGVNRQPGEGIRRRVGNEMAAGGGRVASVPAGFTYLGQFVDHDLTFDKTTVRLGSFISPAELLQARSPSLDLDSLYGAGPDDPESAKFYEADGVHLKMGKTARVGDLAAREGFDLPRGLGNTQAKRRKAIIPDHRNDENLAVASIHLAMIRFHNRVVDTLPASTPASQRFAKARERVTKHYQWMLRTDYLPRIAAPGVVNSVFSQGRKAFEVGVTPTDVPTMPVEFSIAAFRLGHAMVRRAYNWNKVFDNGEGTLDLLFTFSATSGDLAGFPRLPSNWIADFRRLFDFGEIPKPNLVVPPGKFNKAMRIDTTLVDPLKHLPTGAFGGPDVGFNDSRRNLAFRNLTRARMVRLATGQQMARFMRTKGANVTTLTRKELRDGKNGADIGSLSAAQRDAFLRNTPLWFYVLREAEFNAGRLKGVGARIVAETFHRAMEGSTHSIVRDTAFRPKLGPNNQTFRMVDLLFFAFEGKKNLLAPLG
jgi:hypothetical protein